MDLVEQLNYIFYPRTVAVIGASDDSRKIGYSSVRSLLDGGFKGKIYPVNPSVPELFGLAVYPSVKAIPGEVDLAVIAIPAELTLPVIEECAAKGVKGAIMFTSGFKELGTETGLDLQDRIRDVANRGGMKIVGPNCMGVLNTKINLNATFVSRLGSTRAGSVAVASQSGGLCLYIAKALTDNNLGISKIISIGNRCNLYFDEIVRYFAEDEETKVIVLYIEGVERPRQLIAAAREVVRRKPIVAYKAGRWGELNQVSLSHTGVLAGNYEFYKAAFTQAGIMAVDSMTELIDTAKALAFQPPSPGNRVAVLSGPAGLGLIMADKCYELGLSLAKFSTATRQRLRQLISPLNPIDNPVDLAGGIGRNLDAWREILKVVLEDDGVDMIVTGFPYSNVAIKLNRALLDISSHHQKPIAYVSVDSQVREDIMEKTKLEENNIPVYPLPERAITGLAALVKYGRILRTIG